MKVCFIVNISHAEAGGGFTFEQSLLDEFSKSRIGNDYCFLNINRKYLEKLGAKQIYLPIWIRICNKLKKVKWISRLFSNLPTICSFLIKKHNVDFLWCTTPFSVISDMSLPYAFTVWDLSHRSLSFFPEFNSSGWKWDDRENHYKKYLVPASIIITGNETGKNEIKEFYNIPENRIKVIPFSVPSFTTKTKAKVTSLDKWKINEKFLFYPAQFWPHKNHIVILKALKILLNSGYKISVVFTGSDKGNLEYIKKD